MSSITNKLVFSNVVATLSNTLLGKIPGNKGEFLTNYLSSEHVDIITEPYNYLYSISGELKEIVSSENKLAKLMVLQQQVNYKTTQKDENHKLSKQNINEVTSLLVDEEIKVDAMAVVSKSKELPQNVDTVEDDEDSILIESVSTTCYSGKENDEITSDKLNKDQIMKQSKVLRQKKSWKKARQPVSLITATEEEIVNASKIVTKRGRVIKRPAKLDSSVLLLRYQEGMENAESSPKKIKALKKTLVYEKQTTEAIQKEIGQKAKENQVQSGEAIKETEDAKESDDMKSEKITLKTVENTYIESNAEGSVKVNDDEAMADKDTKDVKRQIRKQYEDRMPFKFFCIKCSFKSKRESHYNAHKQLHEKNPELKLYHCKICNYTCVRQSLLKKHQLCHEAEVLECESCSYKTNNKIKLNLHMAKAHGPEKKAYRQYGSKVKCSLCSYTTCRKSKLFSHMQTHSLENREIPKSFSCSECSYSTMKKVHFDRHRKDVHTNRRPFLCDLCGAAFKRTDTLAAHKVTHIDRSKRQLPFRCPVCGKSFRSKAHLLSHTSVHSSVRAYQCHICGQMFKTKQVQQKHQENIHYNPRSFKCSVCNKEFNTKYTLQRHARTHDTDTLYQSDVGGAGQSKQDTAELNQMKNEGVLVKGSLDQTGERIDENLSAIQHITLSEFTQQLQNASDQLHTGTDAGFGTIYIEGFETVDTESGTINIVNMNGQDIHQILIPPRSLTNITQMTSTTATPAGFTESIIESTSEVTSGGLGEIYVSTVSLQEEGTELADTGEIDGVYIQTDQNSHEIKHILVP